MGGGERSYSNPTLWWPFPEGSNGIHRADAHQKNARLIIRRCFRTVARDKPAPGIISRDAQNKHPPTNTLRLPHPMIPKSTVISHNKHVSFGTSAEEPRLSPSRLLSVAEAHTTLLDIRRYKIISQRPGTKNVAIVVRNKYSTYSTQITHASVAHTDRRKILRVTRRSLCVHAGTDLPGGSKQPPPPLPLPLTRLPAT